MPHLTMPHLTMPRAAPDHPRPRTNHRPPPPTQRPALSRIASPSATHELRNTDTISHPAHRLLWCVAISTVIPDPQPSFRRKPESRACGHIHRHSGPPSRHSGASRNPCRVAISTVIPAKAGIQGVWSYLPYSGASRNPCRVAISTVIPPPPTVIPAQPGIQAVWSYSPSFRLPQPSFRRKPESMACGHIHRHSAPPTVIPAQAGIYARRLHHSSRKLRRWIPAFAGMTVAGASQ